MTDKIVLWDYDLHGEVMGGVCNFNNKPCTFELNNTCKFETCSDDTRDEVIRYYTSKGFILEWVESYFILCGELEKDK